MSPWGGAAQLGALTSGLCMGDCAVSLRGWTFNCHTTTSLCLEAVSPLNLLLPPPVGCAWRGLGRAPVLNAQRASHRQPAAGPACRSAPCPAPRPGIGSSIRAHLKRRRKDRPAPRPLVGLLSALRSLRACPLLSSSVT